MKMLLGSACSMHAGPIDRLSQFCPCHISHKSDWLNTLFRSIARFVSVNLDATWHFCSWPAKVSK